MARRVLTWQRLVRAGAVHRKRRRNPAWRAAREAERGRACAWYNASRTRAGARDEEDIAALASWIESAGTRTQQRGDHQIAAAFARHGPPTAAHSAAAAAKEQTATSARRQPDRYGQWNLSLIHI